MEVEKDTVTGLFGLWNTAVAVSAILALGYADMALAASLILGILALSAFVTWSTITYYTFTKS